MALKLFAGEGDAVPARLKEPIEAARRKLSESPADAGAGLRLADLLAEAGQKVEAVRLLGRLGREHQKRGQLVGAIALYKRCVQLDPRFELTSSTFLTQLELKKLLEAPAQEPPAPEPPTRPAPEPRAAAAPAPASPPAEESAWKRKRTRIHEIRAGIPLLREVPPLLFDLVLDKVRLVSLGPGETLFSEGEAGSSVFFVVSGKLEASGATQKGGRSRLGSAGPGDAVGEMSFLTGRPRTATVAAAAQSDLLELDRNALAPIARQHRPLAEALNRLFEERVLLGVLARSRLFGRLPEEERRALLRRLEPMSVKAGTPIVREGETDTGVFVVRDGAVRVTARTAGREVALALLGPSDFFGDLSGLRARKRTATVTAVTPTDLLVLPAQELRALVERYPTLRGALEDIQLERFTANATTLSGRR